MRYFLLFLMIFGLTGCSEDIHYSSFAYGISSTVTFACMDLESKKILNETVYRNLSGEQREEFEQEMEAAERKCDTVGKLIEDLSPSHQRLESGYQYPRTKFLFSIRSSRGHETPIGLFDSEGQCNVARERLLEFGYELLPCYKRTIFWNSVWG